MTIDQAFNHLIKNWASLDPDFKNKYRQYKSKTLKTKLMSKEEIRKKDYYIGEHKKKEMLLAAGYLVIPEVWKLPK